MNNKQARSLFLTAHNFLKGKPLTESIKVEKLSALSDDESADEVKEKTARTSYVKAVEKAMSQEEGYDKITGQEFEQDEEGETCIRCGVNLDSEEGLETGICADCWKPEDEDDVELEETIISDDAIALWDSNPPSRQLLGYVQGKFNELDGVWTPWNDQDIKEVGSGYSLFSHNGEGYQFEWRDDLSASNITDETLQVYPAAASPGHKTKEGRQEVADKIKADLVRFVKNIKESCGKSHKKTMKEALSNEAYELMTFIQNDQDLYKRNIIPSVKNMQRKIAKGTYDHAKAPQLWIHTVNAALPEYAEEFNLSLPQVRTSLFPMSVRQEVAQALADEYRDEIDAQGGKMFDEGAYGKKKTMKEAPQREGIPYEDAFARRWENITEKAAIVERFFRNGSSSQIARDWAQTYDDNFNDEFNALKEHSGRIVDLMDDIEYQISMGLYAAEGAYGKKKTMKEEGLPYDDKYSWHWGKMREAVNKFERLFGKGADNPVAKHFKAQYDNVDDEFEKLKKLSDEIYDVMGEIEYVVAMASSAEDEAKKSHYEFIRK